MTPNEERVREFIASGKLGIFVLDGEHAEDIVEDLTALLDSVEARAREEEREACAELEAAAEGVLVHLPDMPEMDGKAAHVTDTERLRRAIRARKP